MPLPNYNNAILLFVHSKKHHEIGRSSLPFRYEIAEECPLFKGKPYTAAIIIGEGMNLETLKYFEVFDDAVVLGTGSIKDCVPA
jgi:hypothetical protein